MKSFQPKRDPSYSSGTTVNNNPGANSASGVGMASSTIVGTAGQGLMSNAPKPGGQQ
jgi:hypothetical protein